MKNIGKGETMSNLFSIMTVGLLLWMANLVYLGAPSWQLWLWALAAVVSGYLTGRTEEKEPDYAGYYRIDFRADKAGTLVDGYTEMSLESVGETQNPRLAGIIKEVLHSEWGIRPGSVEITQLERIK